MENECIFVSSYGVRRSCNIHPLDNNDKSYLINMNQTDNMSIYVKTDNLYYFINDILTTINKPFFLACGCSDYTIPDECISNDMFFKLLNNKYLIRWLIQNTFYKHDKIIQLPIGLDYHSINNNLNHKWKLPDEGNLPREQESLLITIHSEANNTNRINKIFSNIHLRLDKRNDRSNALGSIPEDLIAHSGDFFPRTPTWREMSKYSFVLSPYGNGYDCHRTWEALCLGCIPIVRAPHFKQLFEDLPVLNVKEWSDVTQELLENTIREFKTKTFNYDKLKLQYWINLMT
jgi:hypothetical protein